MCKYQGPSPVCANMTVFRTLSPEGKAAILEKHNQLRRKVAKGEEVGGINAPQPPAANMRQLEWSTELEEISQRWADQCTFAHDSVRNLLDGSKVGQNVFIGYKTVQEEENDLQLQMDGPVQSWYDEVTNPGFDSQSINPFKFSYGAGHYTQVVWGDTQHLGCAWAYYKDTSGWYNNLVVCNYAQAGNYRNREMYLTGPACSACPGGYTCMDGLCTNTN